MSTFDEVKAIPTGQVFATFFPDHELKRDGRVLAALCVFHLEKTASLKIYANGFKCFGCGSVGTNIDLLMKSGKASSPIEAAKLIADKFGIKFDDKRRAKEGLTLEQLAVAKKLPVSFLKSLKVMNGKYDGKPAVVIIYQTETGDTGVIRYRLKLKGKNNFRSRSGERQILYGLQTLKSVREKGWVMVVEGESDSWTCWYHNIPCLGVAGKTNWKPEMKDYLAGLDVYVWEEPDARDFTLKILADVPNAKIILAPGSVKDISEAHIQGKDIPAFIEELKATALGADQVRESAGDEDVPDWLNEEIFHPALHIDSFAAVGVVTKSKAKYEYRVVTDEGIYAAELLHENFTCKPLVHPELADRWRKVATAPTLSEAVGLLISKTQSLICLEDERLYSALAVWAAGTYLFPLFNTYPYLNLTGEKGSAKTKILDIFHQVCFNPLQIVNPTAAVLFRMVHALRPTLLLDEVESFASEEAREVKQIINAGYKRGATVPRCEGESHTIRFFDVYSPKAIAGIKPLGDVMEDRAIVIIMTKPDASDNRQNMEVVTELVWQTIRNGFYRLPFDYRDKVANTNISLPEWLRARDRELWSPLLKLATIIDDESGLAIYADIIGVAKDSAISKGLTFETEMVLTVLENELSDADEIDIHPFELCEALQKAFNKKTVTPEWIASRLRRLGFKKSDPERDSKGVIYKITRARIDEIRCRYRFSETTYTPTYTATCIVPIQ